jgi:hypothetical protein
MFSISKSFEVVLEFAAATIIKPISECNNEILQLENHQGNEANGRVQAFTSIN